MTTDLEIADPPTDGISAVRFSDSHPNLLLACSWDKKVRLYDVQTNLLLQQYDHQAPVLDCYLNSDSTAYSAGLDQRVLAVDLSTKHQTVLGMEHTDTVKCLEYWQDKGIVISGGWDRKLCLYDPRQSVSGKAALISSHEVPERVYAMSVSQSMLVVGTAGRHVHIYDCRQMKEPFQRRESSLKFQTRAIRCFPDAKGYVISSIEGRVAVDYFDPSEEVQAKKYAFKCHRQNIDGVDTVYPVHALAFHAGYGTFASGGGDGTVCIWDGQNKKRIRQFPRYPTSISSLSFNSDGSLLAVASSYCYEEGEKDHEPDSLFIKTISDADVRPKHIQA